MARRLKNLRPVYVLIAGACVFLAVGSAVSAQFAQQTVFGVATGSIYALLALALVLIYRATSMINFAQGEIAMFTTFIAWELWDNGVPYWGAFFATMAIAFVGGLALERIAIRPVESASRVTVVIVTIGLLLFVHGAAAWIWGADLHPFPSAFPVRPIHVGGVAFSLQDLGTILILLVAVSVLWAFFRFTTVGLAMRAAATTPLPARLVGVRVSWMLALGWGLAAALGAVAGMMAAAPPGVLEVNLMQAILIYAFAAAVLGGLESPAGAVVGGIALGVFVNLLGTYVDDIKEHSELKLPVALGVLLVVLLVKPSGLFGRPSVRKV
jgi:branched-chain amino acid transport system permease protein